MIDLTTKYMGLNLKNPLVASASPLSKKVETAKKLEEAGVSKEGTQNPAPRPGD